MSPPRVRVSTQLATVSTQTSRCGELAILCAGVRNDDRLDAKVQITCPAAVPVSHLCLIGVSDSGKSTFPCCPQMLESIDEGSISLFGESLSDGRSHTKARRRACGGARPLGSHWTARPRSGEPRSAQRGSPAAHSDRAFARDEIIIASLRQSDECARPRRTSARARPPPCPRPARHHDADHHARNELRPGRRALSRVPGQRCRGRTRDAGAVVHQPTTRIHTSIPRAGALRGLRSHLGHLHHSVEQLLIALPRKVLTHALERRPH